MTDPEAIMWAVEKDPALRSDFCNLTILDRLPSRERLRAAVEAAIGAIPRLGQRVVSAPLRLVPPAWVDDPDLDLDYHVRHVRVPEPGGNRELLDLVAALAEVPLDRSRPLWEFTLVEGLEGGRAALLQKVHHTITDGVGGLRLSLALVDFERDPSPDPAAPRAIALEAALRRREELLADPLRRETPVGVVRDAVRDVTARGAELAARTTAEAIHVATHPSEWGRRAAEALDLAASVRRQVVVTEQARSDVMASRSLGRRYDVTAVPLVAAKATAQRLDGTLNDVYVTALTGAFGEYHAKLGGTARELRMAMPVSTRASGDRSTNRFAPSRVLVPIAIADPVERFREVQRRLAPARAERALHAAEGLAMLAAPLPTALLVTLVRNQTRTIDFVGSNLRGSPVPLYLAGTRIEASFPFGPRTGCAVNVTMLSYCDELLLGVNLDPAAVTEPELFAACLDRAFDEVLHARVAPRTRRPKARVGTGASS